MGHTKGLGAMRFGLIVLLAALVLVVAAVSAPHANDCPAYIGAAPDCGSFGPIAFLSGVVLAIGGVVLILMGWTIRRDDGSR